MRILFSLLMIALPGSLLFSQMKDSLNSKQNEKSEINSSMIKYMSGNDSVHAYLASPKKEGKHPGLIVIHEWWGLMPWIKSNSDEFAKRGYAALAIDLYRGKSTSSPDEAHQLSRGVPEDRAVKDLKSAYDYLKESAKY